MGTMVTIDSDVLRELVVAANFTYYANISALSTPDKSLAEQIRIGATIVFNGTGEDLSKAHQQNRLLRPDKRRKILGKS